MAAIPAIVAFVSRRLAKAGMLRKMEFRVRHAFMVSLLALSKIYSREVWRTPTVRACSVQFVQPVIDPSRRNGCPTFQGVQKI